MTRRDEGSALDTLRWGDAEALLGLEKLSGIESDGVVSKQLVQAHWKWPLSWAYWAMFIPSFDSTESATFTAEVNLTIGVGQGQATTKIRYAIAPTGAVYFPVNDQKLIPGQDLQIRVNVTGKAALSNPNGQDILLVGVFVAPQTEPHAMREILETMRGQGEDQVEWMREGFHPQGLHYRR
jgi:hypothetical protein